MTSQPLIEKELTRSAIGAFFEVYNTLALPFRPRAQVLPIDL
jgi:hypothetical protein